jgi:aspartyl-tRNA(Asn)/glutamyl-tRNA(Gln) amidotransferase subunit C
MSLQAKDVAWVAHLARLHLDEADFAKLTEQLSAIVDYVAQLQQVPTEGVEPLAHPLPLANVFRDDEPTPSLPTDEALANAPARAGNFFSVPPVLE